MANCPRCRRELQSEQCDFCGFNLLTTETFFLTELTPQQRAEYSTLIPTHRPQAPVKRTGIRIGIFSALAVILCFLYFYIQSGNGKAESVSDTVAFSLESNPVIASVTEIEQQGYKDCIPTLNGTYYLMDNGTVRAVNVSESSDIDTSSWTDIVQIAASPEYIVGLKSDGTTVASGREAHNCLDVSGWENIKKVLVGKWWVTYGITEDGKMIFTRPQEEQHYINDIDQWSDIADISDISIVDNDIFALRTDGTILSTGCIIDSDAEYDDTVEFPEMERWTDIVSLATSEFRAYAVKADGTVLYAGGATFDGINADDLLHETNVLKVSAGDDHVVFLHNDGSVSAYGRNTYGQCNVTEWSNIADISTTDVATIGYKSDGSIIRAGFSEVREAVKSAAADFAFQKGVKDYIFTENANFYLQTDKTVSVVPLNTTGLYESVSEWKDIVQISTNDYYGHTEIVGLKADGTVVASGYTEDSVASSNDFYKSLGESWHDIREVKNWTDVTRVIQGGWGATYGVTRDNKVLCTESSFATQQLPDGRRVIPGWSDIVDIVEISSASLTACALKSDGTVLLIGEESSTTFRDASNWSDIVSIAATGSKLVGLKSDGTAVYVGPDEYDKVTGANISSIQNGVQLAGSEGHLLVLYSNGTVGSFGDNAYGSGNVKGWTDIAGISTTRVVSLGFKANNQVLAAGKDVTMRISVE